MKTETQAAALQSECAEAEGPALHIKRLCGPVHDRCCKVFPDLPCKTELSMRAG